MNRIDEELNYVPHIYNSNNCLNKHPGNNIDLYSKACKRKIDGKRGLSQALQCRLGQLEQNIDLEEDSVNLTESSLFKKLSSFRNHNYVVLLIDTSANKCDTDNRILGYAIGEYT